jgi:hypothetical protein
MGIDLHNVDTVFNSSGIFNNVNKTLDSNQLVTGIHNFRQDYLIHNIKIDYTITKWQIYGEYAVLG